jgi:hypothetical protein
MTQARTGYTLELLPNEIHAYRFHDMANETWDAWVAHRMQYRQQISPDYLDLNILDLSASNTPSTYAIKSVTKLGQTANRTRFLYAILGQPGFMIDLIRITASAATLWRADEPVQAFSDEAKAIEWLNTRAAEIRGTAPNV